MEKKKFTSWGVSFASLALVAGMASYLGIKDNQTKTNSATSAVTTQSSNTTTTSQSTNSQNSSFTIKYPEQTSNSNGTQQTTTQSSNTNGAQQSTTQTVSQDHSSANQHDGFDTTTGGT
ncbi:hypothetical protein HPT25_04985 [Bacillus sp. BRMEA1]|uniref:hypothetical protein n=1 Tax=Neobacillus endophyticus TaxID=2738405 RepID=UPI0015644435|nr:hypothetical protein [Neobacillus endophyticus]NRD76846.1 hypothetical protein [Neobacillus endophyticus]